MKTMIQVESYVKGSLLTIIKNSDGNGLIEVSIMDINGVITKIIVGQVELSDFLSAALRIL